MDPETRERINIKGSPPPPAVHLGLNFAVAMGLFSYLGYRIDEKRGGGGAFTLAGIFLGLFYGGYEVWKLVRRPPDDDANRPAPPPGSRSDS